jgi:hypothetical protein
MMVIREIDMARFYLNIRRQGDFCEDIEGADYYNLDAAHSEAILAARELVCEHVAAGKSFCGSQFEICDDAGRLLLTVPFKHAIVFG